MTKKCNSACDMSYLKDLAKDDGTYLSFETAEKMTWCGGCGNYGIQNALKRALVLEGYRRGDFALFYDIGCNGNESDKFHAYTFHGLHGRVISAAAGGAIANTDMKVIASAGDGATLSEGINHLIHAVRNDYPMVFILHNNQNYGLTTGQASATTRKGHAMNASPDGVIADPMNPSELVLNLGPTFVARTFSGDMKHMTHVLQEALKHNGFAFVEVMQMCPTYNKATPSKWFWERITYTEDIKGYDVTDLEKARKASHDIYDEMVMGVLYQDTSVPDFMDRLISRKGKKSVLIDEVDHVDVSELLKKYM